MSSVIKALLAAAVGFLYLAHISAVTCPSNEKIIVCYYASWSYYRKGEGNFNLARDLDPQLCTHVVYTFAGLNLDSKISSLDPYYDTQLGGYQTFTNLKQANPCLKTILSIGGWNEGSQKYSVMAYSTESREAFADSVLRYLVAYNFDGLDLDWEYPTQRGGIEADKRHFVELLKALRERFEIWNLMLTIAVPISTEISEKAYEIQEISRYVDYIFLMAYDFTAGNSEMTGLSTPLSSISKIVEWWLSKLPKKNLVLGTATYGRTFTLQNAAENGIGAKTKGPGKKGPYTQEPGFLSYYELQAKFQSGRYKMVQDDSCYYAYYKDEWITFDLEDTYAKKVEYALSKGLPGIMVWTIDTDDFAGNYSGTAYPVVTAIKRALNK